MNSSLIEEDNHLNKSRSLSDDDKLNRESIDNRDFEYWYPSWETWQFRRTLSYWVAVLFIEGSALFVIGAACSMSEVSKLSSAHSKALVSCPYLVGGICFTLGAYAGFL
jgi:hypothetical protein